MRAGDCGLAAVSEDVIVEAGRLALFGQYSASTPKSLMVLRRAALAAGAGCLMRLLRYIGAALGRSTPMAAKVRTQPCRHTWCASDRPLSNENTHVDPCRIRPGLTVAEAMSRQRMRLTVGKPSWLPSLSYLAEVAYALAPSLV
jgi:hypothetical protein